MEKPRKSVFPVGFRNKGRDTAKYQFSSRGERLEKQVFQVMKGRQHHHIRRFACHPPTSVRPRKPVFQVGSVRKVTESEKNHWKAVGIANSSLIRRNLKCCYNIKTIKTSRTGCDYSTREITREKAENIASTWNNLQPRKLVGRVALPTKRQRNCHNRY